jgi:hypothetical protein
MVSDVQGSGDVFSQGYAGGLIGYASLSPINNATASGAVTGLFDSGGLVGYLDRSDVSASQASGQVLSTSSRAGGLVGFSSR